MACTNLMKALKMWIYGASVAAKLSIHGFRSPLILIEVIDHDGSKELLNPSGRKQLHLTTSTPTLKAARHFSKVLAARTAAFCASQTAPFTNYAPEQFFDVFFIV